MPEEKQRQFPDLPSLYRDPAFWGMSITQLLGAFNDNLFKQMVLLLCLDYKIANNLSSDPYQTTATLLFTIPFVIFSGLAGYLSDRFSKRFIVVASKVFEIVVMAAGLIAFFIGVMGSTLLINMLFVVLMFMGLQSAFFGPPKYGILPEMLNEEDLPAANGFIQMTTFLAIIFGMGLAGVLKEHLGNHLYVISGLCVLLAIAGTYTSTLLRKTAVANANLKFSISCLVIERHAWSLILRDRLLFWVLVVYSMFWFAGGVVLPVVNSIGKDQLDLGDQNTGLLSACLGIGIAFGCVVSGKASKKQVRFGLVTVGLIGMSISLAIAAVICPLKISLAIRVFVFAACLVSAGGFAGLLAVPLQVFIQARPPIEQKGRMIGAMNLITWIGILISSVYYYAFTWLFGKLKLPVSWTLLTLGILMLGVAFFFRPSAISGPRVASNQGD